MTVRCEDYPCCGHTAADPCERQWYDKPGAFDTSRPGNEHALCDHENGFCEVDDDDDEDYCGCCGGLAAQPPKGEHSSCCAEEHDHDHERCHVTPSGQEA